jgi:hypothetical protein
MSPISPYQTKAMLRELAMIKEAGGFGSAAARVLRSGYRAVSQNPALVRGAGATGNLLSSGYGKQLALGAGVGAAGGAATADEGSRLRGAAMGAGIGFGLAGGRALATKSGREAAKRFGGRQRYYLTGHGAKTTKDAKRLGIIKDAPDKAKFVDKKGRFKGTKYEKARAKHQHSVDMFGENMTNAPGVVGNLMQRPGWTMRQGWKRSDMFAKGLVGMEGYNAAKGFAQKPEEGGPGRLQKGLTGLGSGVGWLVAPQAMLPGALIGMGGSSLGNKIGKFGDKAITGKRQVQGSTQRNRGNEAAYPQAQYQGQRGGR